MTWRLTAQDSVKNLSQATFHTYKEHIHRVKWFSHGCSTSIYLRDIANLFIWCLLLASSVDTVNHYMQNKTATHSKTLSKINVGLKLLLYNCNPNLEFYSEFMNSFVSQYIC